MKKHNLLKLSIIIIIYFLNLAFASAQNKIIANLKSFDLCQIEINGEISNCKKGINGALLVSTIEIEPNRKITIYLKDKSFSYSENWNSSSLSINDNNLFIYVIKDGFLNCRIVLNQDYSFIAIVHVVENNTLVTAYDK